MKRAVLGMIFASMMVTPALAAEGGAVDNFRRPEGDVELRSWLENMVWHHRFTIDEVTAATGLEADEVTAALKRFGIRRDNRPKRAAGGPILVLPYPGGRHPRIGFLEGAIRPQRETKVSIFTPWDDTSYVVLDVPEAIWWDVEGGRELLYLAHTHIPTTWSKKNVEMEKLEWKVGDDGTFLLERRLPNNVVFGTKIVPGADALRMEMWLTNGTDKTLTGLRVQNCIMLKGTPDFEPQTNDNKVLKDPYAACGSPDGKRWVITAWEPNLRAWGNPPCPCLHSDPKFPDCAPGETSRLTGWVSFYEGTDVEAEFRRIEGIRKK